MMRKDCYLTTPPTGVRSARCHLLPLPAALSVFMLGTAVSPALAQTSEERGTLAIGGGVQTAASDFSSSVRFGHALFGPEEGSFDTQYPAGDDALFDVGGSVRVWRNLAVGANVSWLTREHDADVSAQLPHPFWFDRSRSIGGAAPGLSRTETAVHVQAQWVIPVGRSVAVTLFGGPTWFRVNQDLVDAVDFEQTYPYGEATFTGVDVRGQSASAIGVNVGADASYYFSSRLGVGGTVRFSRGSVELVAPDGGSFKSTAGGLQTTGGLRVRF